MVDVCLLLEGTYPFVTGGVSSWVHQLVTNMPQVQFGIVHLSSGYDPLRTPKYQMPGNIVFMQELFLHEYNYKEIPKNLGKFRRLNESEKNLAEQIQSWDDPYFINKLGILKEYFKKWPTFEQIAFSFPTWEFIVKRFEDECPDQSFLDYFWTWRFTHFPLLRILLYPFPKAKLYHTVSTGYAGLCAAVAKIKNNSHMILTEHGIYTKERKIEIQSAEWIYQSETLLNLQEKRDFFKTWWIEMFEFLSQICYNYSDDIITLHTANKLLQVQGGADPNKTKIIPNGVYIEKYQTLRKKFFERDKSHLRVIGFVGRVVPIKDVKTFIRAMKIVSDTISDLKVLILGPTEEDLDYFQECQQLVEMLELTHTIEFTGSVAMDQYYPILDLIVLTSISESQPLVILEANAIGIPCVATQVGACREMLEGLTEDDKAIGNCGYVTQISNPQQTAERCLQILLDPSLHHQLGQNGIRRVETYYRQDQLISEYFTLYQDFKYR